MVVKLLSLLLQPSFPILFAYVLPQLPILQHLTSLLLLYILTQQLQLLLSSMQAVLHQYLSLSWLLGVLGLHLVCAGSPLS